jgi:excisionase family DNA binding protein
MVTEMIDTGRLSAWVDQKKALEPLVTRKQVAELLSVSLRTVDRWIARGDLPHYKLGKVVRFKVSDIQEKLETKWKAGLNRSRF